MAISDQNARIAMLSIHSSPIGKLGTADTGGMSVYLLELAKALGRQGVMVDIFTREIESGTEQLIEYADNVRIVTLPMDGTKALHKSELLRHLPSYRQAIETFACNNEESYRLVHSNYWLSGIVGDQLKTRWHCPHVITFHTLAAAKIAARKNHRENQHRLTEEIRLLQCCDAIIAPTAGEQKKVQAIIKKETAPVYIVPLGVDQEHFKPSEGVAVSTVSHDVEHPVVLFVGRFDPMKGADIAIRALHLVQKKAGAHLLVIGGDGHQSEEFQRLKELVNDLGMKRRVHFLGSIEYHKMPAYYQQADAVVVSSFYESFGLVILEALSTGTPVAATRAGIAPEVIKDGINGYLASAVDPPSLSAVLARTLELASAVDREMIRQSVGDYTWSKVAGLTLDVYNELLSEC